MTVKNNPVRFLSIVCLCFVFLCVRASDSILAGSRPDIRPNIILLLTDDQRNDTLGCAGHPIVQTPNIDRLAAQGVRFENCFVTTSICAASRASIFTGLHERTHGYTFGKPAVNRDYTLTSYPVLLRRSGYRTGFIGKFGVRMEDSKAMFDFNKTVPGPGYLKQSDGSSRESTDVMGDLAKDFIAKDDDRPFCLSVSFHASHAKDSNKTPGMGHYPYPEGVSDLYSNQTMPVPNLSDPKYFETLPDFLKTSMNRERFFWRWDTPEKYQVNMRAYLRMISGIDRVVGQLIETLEQKGLAENTVIIYTADNGYYMADRGFAGKWSHFEQSLRVPLIVYDPRLPDNKRARLVHPTALNIDLAPTILELAHLRIPEHYQGRSLTPVLNKNDAKDAEPREAFFCEHLMDNALIPKWQGVRTPRYKYARYFEQVPAFEFLHDLKADPTEFKNLALDPRYGDVLAKMRAKTDALAAQYAQTLMAETLRCEYQVNPLGIDEDRPRLSWTLQSDVRAQTQTAYQVIVSTRAEEIKANRGGQWDSGKVASKESIQVVYEGKKLTSATRYYWKVRVWDKNGKAGPWSKASWFETALLNPNDWHATWINDGKPNPEVDEDFYKFDPAPLFRKEFALTKPVKQARLYITGLGYYQASMNGGRIGDHRLDPGWTRFSKRVYYSTYNVTGQLQDGQNCLGVTLGNGWYNPMPLRMWGHKNLREHVPVGRPRFISQLHIRYTDGSTESICSDEHWKVTQGPILRNSIYLGEIYDARKEIADWDKPGFDDSAWSKACLAKESMGRLQAQPLEPIKVTATVKPVAMTEPKKGVYIVDMGQNFGGWARFTFNVPEGTEITMRYGELLYENGTLNLMTSVCGQIKRKKPTADGSPPIAWQADTYIARGGGPETYTPLFTFHAFRYVEITGLPARPSLDDVEGLRMNSAVEPVGSFSCSNDLFNRIQTMCQWTFLSNLFGVQSDCPHRERFGYGGDLVTTSDAFMLNYDMANFYAKVARDWHDSALSDGMLTDTAPSVGIQYCGVGWAMAHPHLQVQLYRYYGDRRIIEEQYATSKRWLELVRGQNADHIVRQGLHDHEALEKEESPAMITPLYCESARMLSRLARILEKEEEADEYDRLAENIRKAYIEKFLAAGTGVVVSGIQSVQAFALFLNMLPAEERPAALAHLVRDITDKHNGHLTTGIFGTRYMLDVLSRERRAEVVNDMVNLGDFPGWGYMLEQGATTLWEHWKFSDNTFSHNHPMFGSVSQWFYNWLGGIEPTVDAVGFDKFTFQPQFLEGLDWVRCRYRSVRGPITCNWKRQGDRAAMDLHVPVNTSATLILPTAGTITENGRPAADSEGVEEVSELDGSAKLRLASGRYHLIFAPSE
ncbi:MAG: family 78 glycoside hydrolase catalytic domain [Planctomycetota bacterium]